MKVKMCLEKENTFEAGGGEVVGLAVYEQEEKLLITIDLEGKLEMLLCILTPVLYPDPHT